MQAADKRAFKDALDLAYETVGKPLPSTGVLTVFWASLESYPLDAVLRAISKHVKASEFAPTPAAILKHLPAESDGRPEVDEAWAIALRSRDERDTVVWTQECAEAFSAATPVLEMGDDVGARMAFKAAYTRIVERNRSAGQPAQWLMSLGFDASLREAAAREAVRTGRLSLEHASRTVSALARPDAEAKPEVAQQQLSKLRDLVGSIPSTEEKLERAQQAVAQASRETLAEFKRAAAQRVAEYEARQ